MRVESEQTLRALTSRFSEPLTQRLVCQETDYSRGEPLDVPWSHEQPRDLVFNYLRDTATATSDDRTPGRHRLGQDAAEGLRRSRTVNEHVETGQYHRAIVPGSQKGDQLRKAEFLSSPTNGFVVAGVTVGLVDRSADDDELGVAHRVYHGARYVEEQLMSLPWCEMSDQTDQGRVIIKSELSSKSISRHIRMELTKVHRSGQSDDAGSDAGCRLYRSRHRFRNGKNQPRQAASRSAKDATRPPGGRKIVEVPDNRNTNQARTQSGQQVGLHAIGVDEIRLSSSSHGRKAESGR